ncbi:NADPH:quinone reductase [Pseudogymnoascus australis]
MASSVPTTMRAIKIPHTGGLEVLELHNDIPVPTPAAGQILIKTAVAGVNYIDTYLRTGLYPPPASGILGQEAEGTVVAVSAEGDTYGFKIGDRVAAFAPAGGAYAEYVAVPAQTSFKLPKGIEEGLGAASLLQGLTALTLIRESHPVKKGETILVHAAAGGVGLWLCQLLRAVGAKVIATASTAEKLALAKENGADELVNYKTHDFVAEVQRITNGAGVAAVFDGVGAATFEGSFASVARKGSLVSFGNASGPVPPFTIARLGAKNIKVLRPRLGAYVETREEFETYSTELFGFIADGKVGVKVHGRYKLEDVAKAQGELEGRGTVGKLLLVL